MTEENINLSKIESLGLPELQKQLSEQLGDLNNFQKLENFFSAEENQGNLADFLDIYNTSTHSKEAMRKHIDSDIENAAIGLSDQPFFLGFKSSFGENNEKKIYAPKEHSNEDVEVSDENIEIAQSLREKYAEIFDDKLAGLHMAETDKEGVFVFTKSIGKYKQGDVVPNNNGEVYKAIFEKHYQEFLDAAKKESPQAYVETYELFESLQKGKFVELKGLEKDGNQFDFALEKNILEPNGDGYERREQIKTVIITDSSKYYPLVIEDGKATYHDQQIEKNIKYIKDPKSEFRIQSTDISDVKRNKEYLEQKGSIEKSLGLIDKELVQLDKGITSFQESEREMEEFSFSLDSDEVEDQIVAIGRKYGRDRKVKKLVKELQNDENNLSKQEKLKKAVSEYIEKEKNKLEDQKEYILENKDTLKKDLDRLEYHEKQRVGEIREKIQEEDKKAREMMDALRLLGMHLLPQSVFDQIEKIINEEDALRGQIKLKNEQGLNGEVDFGNLEVGQSPGETYKRVLVQLINKALTGSPESPHSIEGFVNGNVLQMKPAEFRYLANTKIEDGGWGIITNGSVKPERIRENLTKPVQQVMDDTGQGVRDILNLKKRKGQRKSRRQQFKEEKKKE